MQRMPEDEIRHKRQKFQRTSRACTYCRQKKLKCDAIQRFPNRCSQCEKYSYYCEINADFRRSSRVAQDVQVKSDDTEPTSSSSSALKSFTKTKEEVDKHNNYLLEQAVQSGDPIAQARRLRYKFLYETSPLPDEKIGDVTIPGDVLRSMFRTFYASFYHHLPIFSREYLDPTRLVNEKKMVFWAICTVASPIVCPEYTNLLMGHVRGLLHSAREKFITQSAISSVQLGLSYIIASLVFCMWVPAYAPKSTSQREDQSWMTTGTAFYLGMQMGLHRSSYQEEFENSDVEDSQERKGAIASLCWAGIFLLTQTQSCYTGLPNVVSMNKNVYNHLNRLATRVPELESFIARLKIMQALKNGIDAMGNNPDTDLGLVEPSARGLMHTTVVNAFSQTVTSIGFYDKWNELLFLMGKLQLHSFLLAPDTLPGDQKSVAVPLFLVCVKIIKIGKELIETEPYYRSIPTVFQKMPVVCALILFGMSFSTRFESLIDATSCRNAISDAYQLYKNVDCPFRSNYRALVLIESIQELHKHEGIKEPIFEVKTRLGAGGFISLMIKLKRQSPFLIQQRLMQAAHPLMYEQLQRQRQQQQQQQQQERKPAVKAAAGESTPSTTGEFTIDMESPMSNDGLNDLLSTVWGWDFPIEET